jgi:hypothetical protein
MKSLVLYLVLVGSPLLGLLGILRAGERIVPPRLMGGEWELEPSVVHEGLATCFEQGSGDESWSVSQSGTRAEILLPSRPRLRMSGEIRGDSLVGTAIDGRTSICPLGLMRIRAELRESEGAEFLHGTLSRDDCAPCSPMPFVARRIAP